LGEIVLAKHYSPVFSEMLLWIIRHNAENITHEGTLSRVLRHNILSPAGFIRPAPVYTAGAGVKIIYHCKL